jgi:hypothetical protein
MNIKTWLAALLSLTATLCLPGIASAQQITCESKNYQQEFCATGGTVTRAWLVAQRSRAPCIEGQTWGYQNNGIWVNQGCEGDFGFQAVAAPVAPVAPGGFSVTCESRNYQQQNCPTGLLITNAWLTQQISSAPCIQGRTWGFVNGDIWVTQGCSGQFSVQGRGAPAAVMPPPYVPANGTLVCESRDYQQAFCPTGRRVSSAWLVAQRSRAACLQGRTWGYDQGGIWVTQGCEGEFGFE